MKLLALLAVGVLADSASAHTTPSRLDCTRTVTVFRLPSFTNGPTLTVWTGSATTATETTTLTSTADCSGCAHVTAITKSRGGHGPVVHHTATVTLQAPDATKTATRVVYVCKESQASGESDEPLATTQLPRHAAMPAQMDERDKPEQ